MKLFFNLKTTALLALISVQTFCAGYFIYDAATDFFDTKDYTLFYSAMELVASLSLAIAILIEVYFLRSLMQDYIKAERSLMIAQGNVQDAVGKYFHEWGLTKAEADVAMLAIKGFSITEIASFRQAQEGTVKTQLTSIYKKAGVTGRNQLGSLLIEDLMGRAMQG